MYELTDEQILSILNAQPIRKIKVHIPTDVFDEERFRVVSQKYIPLLDITPITNSFESKGEKECKRVLEEYYQKPFIKCHPEELSMLKLDLFNSELGIACEYNGIQHYVYPSRFIKKKKDFTNLLKQDLYKRQLCKKLGIHLITVPFTIELKEIMSFILQRL